jgi:Zn-dependent protease
MMSFLSSLERFNLPLGRWLGFPVILHWSFWPLIVALFYWNPVWAIVYSLAFVLVLLHELGHMLAARYCGWRTADIMLYPYGGAAYVYSSGKPKEELIVVLAGPMVNVLLIPLLLYLGQFHSILKLLSVSNWILLGFNLLPAYPTDGGRALKAILTWITGNPKRSLEWAVGVGVVFCLGFVALSFYLMQPLLLVIAYILYRGGQKELQQANAYTYQRYFAPQSARAEAAEIIADTQRELEKIEQRHRNKR